MSTRGMVTVWSHVPPLSVFQLPRPPGGEECIPLTALEPLKSKSRLVVGWGHCCIYANAGQSPWLPYVAGLLGVGRDDGAWKRLLAIQVAQSARFRMCFEGKAIQTCRQLGGGVVVKRRMSVIARLQQMGVPLAEVQKLGGSQLGGSKHRHTFFGLSWTF